MWDEVERSVFVDLIARNPTAGMAVPGTGGIRKVRWSASGRGKWGGARIIYFYHDPGMPVFLLTADASASRRPTSPGAAASRSPRCATGSRAAAVPSAARVLLRVIEREPAAVERALLG
jgi:hypothetical protein